LKRTPKKINRKWIAPIFLGGICTAAIVISGLQGQCSGLEFPPKKLFSNIHRGNIWGSWPIERMSQLFIFWSRGY
jgi:hypothetical protein